LLQTFHALPYCAQCRNNHQSAKNNTNESQQHPHELPFLEYEHEYKEGYEILVISTIVLVVVLVLGSLSKHPCQELPLLEDELEYEDDYDYA
jgi:hypothetical protein